MLIPWFTMSWMTWSLAEAETLSLGIRPANSSSVEQAARLNTGFRAIMNSREQLHAQWEEDAYCGALGLVDCLLSRGSDAGVELAIGGELVGSNHRGFIVLCRCHDRNPGIDFGIGCSRRDHERRRNTRSG